MLTRCKNTGLNAHWTIPVLFSLAFVLGLEQKSLALAKQILGLAGLVICQTNNTATMLKSTFNA